MPSTPPSAISITCPACGLPNIPERQTCKRCRSPLTPTAQERQQLMAMARHNPTLWLRLIPVFIIWALCGGAVMFRVFNNEPWMPKPGGVIDIRANGVAILRMATKTPPEHVEIYEDGLVSRYSYPIQSAHASRLTFTAAEQHEFEQFRLQWCQQLPTFRPLGPTEPFYDLGIRCGGYTVKQAKVPLDMLPPFFTKLLQRL